MKNQTPKIRLLALLICWLAGSQGMAQGIKFAHGSVAEVMQLAKSSNKLVFVDCITDWCGPCKWMAANTFTDEAVGKLFNDQFINYQLDMEKGEGLEFAQKYSVNAYPTLLFLDGDGHLVHAAVGGLPADKFIELAKIAQDPEKRIGALAAEFDKGNHSVEFLTTYLQALSKAGLSTEGPMAMWKAAIKPEELLEKEAYFNIFELNFRRLDSEFFLYFKGHLANFVQTYGQERIDYQLANCYMSAIYRAMHSEDQPTAEKLRKEYASLGGAFAANQLIQLDYREALEQKDQKRVIAIGTTIAEQHSWDDWNTLNMIAWDFYENIEDKKALKSATKWAQRSIELNRSYFNVDTYGMLLAKLGQKQDAIAQLEAAIELAKVSGDDYSSTQEALDELR